MRILVVSKDESLAEYLRGQGHETKTVFTNDIAPRAAGQFSAEAVVYCASVLALEKHEDVIRALQVEGRRVILIAGKNDPALGFAAALGVTDLLTFPVDPADVLYRLENPATREEAADLVRWLAEGKGVKLEEKPEEEKREKRRLPFKLPGKKKREEPEKGRAKKKRFALPFRKRKEQPEDPVEEEHPGELETGVPGEGNSGEWIEGLSVIFPEEEEKADKPEPAPPSRETPSPPADAGEPDAPGKPSEKPKAAPEHLVAPEEAYRDALTGCCARRFLLERYSCPGSYTVVFIDLDNFKPINDILGHEAGDRVLAAFGKMLNDHLKGRDVAVRWGGDEFVLVLPDTPPKSAEKVVENLRRAWEKAAPDTGNLKVGFSAGVSTGGGADGLPEAIRAADKAMYARKSQDKTGRREAVYAPPPQVIVQAVPVPGAPARKESWWGAARQAVSTVFVILEATVFLSAGIWLTHQALLLFGKSPPWLAKVNGVVEWFWSSLWTGIFG